MNDLRTFIENNVTGLKITDHSGYKNILHSDEYYAIKSIIKNRPSIISGSSHAWIADGVIQVDVSNYFNFYNYGYTCILHI